MAEEAKPTEGKESSAIPRSPSEQGVEILAEHPAKEAPTDLGGLFSDESRPSDADLGKDTAEKSPAEPSPQEKKEEPKKEEKAPETAAPEPKGDEKKPEEKKVEEKKEEPGKPPEGYVPKQALAEARGQIKALKAEVEALKVQKPQEAPVVTDEDAKWKDFKKLSDAEYDQLVDDDPTSALKYDRKLREYDRYQDRKERLESEAKAQTKHLASLVQKSMEEIDKVYPGIYDEEKGPEIREKLASVAMESGFDNDDYLSALTNPETRIVPPGSTQSYLIGPGAKGIINLLKTLSEKNSVEPQKLRAEITKELEPKLRETITKELLSKFKGTDKEAFRSLTQVPGSGEVLDTPKLMTEDEWAKKSPEEREKLLGA